MEASDNELSAWGNTPHSGWDDDEDKGDDFWNEKGWDETALPQPSLYRQQSYEVLSTEDIQKKLNETVNSVMEQCFVSHEEASILLRAYNWRITDLIDEWLEDSNKVRERVGVIRVESPEETASRFTCEFCLNSTLLRDSLEIGCGHRYCRECWKSWVTAETDKGPSSIFTNCPSYKCTQVIPEKIILELLPAEKKDLFQKWLLGGFIRGVRYLMWCPSPNCENAVEYRSGGIKEIECDCGYIFCFKCGKPGHRPCDCEIVEKWLVKNSSDSENVNWMLSNTKICPKCSVRIEKNQGCNHMSCRNCSYEFCWLCKGEWAQHGSATGGYYKCNKYEADKGSQATKEETKAEEARNALQKYMFYFTRYDNHDKSIKFAEDTRKNAESVMGKLQDKLGSNYQDVQFVLNAVNAVISCRRVLKWTYCFGYYLENEMEKQIFENHQERLEKFTEYLHGLSEKPIEELLENKTRTEIVNYTRVVEKVCG